MASGLHDAAVINVHDPVAAADRGETVGDDEGGSSLKHGVEAGLQGFFRLDVDAGGGLVEDQDGGIGEQGSRKGDELFLALTQHRAAFPDFRIVPLGHPADEVVGADDSAGFADLILGGSQFSVTDVVADGSGENETVLHHDSHLGTERVDRHLGDILAIDQHPAAVHVVEAGDQVDDGTFSGAGGADQGHALAGFHREGDIF